MKLIYIELVNSDLARIPNVSTATMASLVTGMVIAVVTADRIGMGVTTGEEVTIEGTGVRTEVKTEVKTDHTTGHHTVTGLTDQLMIGETTGTNRTNLDKFHVVVYLYTVEWRYILLCCLSGTILLIGRGGPMTVSLTTVTTGGLLRKPRRRRTATRVRAQILTSQTRHSLSQQWVVWPLPCLHPTSPPPPVPSFRQPTTHTEGRGTSGVGVCT